MTKTLEYFELEFARAIEFNPMIRSYRLANLMSEMERNFDIPMVTSDEFNEKHLRVIDLYRRVSIARDL